MSIVCILIMLAAEPDTISHRVTFSLGQFVFSSSQGYDSVMMEDALYMQTPGYPSLPRTSLIFTIPFESRITAIESSVHQLQNITGSYLIYPTQAQVILSTVDSVQFTQPDSAVYSLINPWPSCAAEGSVLGNIDGTKLARIDVYPLTWNPGTGELALRGVVDVAIILEEDSVPLPMTITMTNTSWRNRLSLLDNIVANSDSIESYSILPNIIDENTKGTDDFPVTVEYVIITRDEWMAAWQPLIDWNIKRGLFTEVLTLEQIANLAGTLWAEGQDWPETIRNSIRWHHDYRGAHYFLFGTYASPIINGTYNTDEVPMRYCRLYTNLFTSWNYTDWYFSCLDPLHDWQTNGNPPWGEYYPPGSSIRNDFMDLIPDVSIGRIPVHSSIEARDAALHIVDYQKHIIAGSQPASDLLVVSAAAYLPGFPETWEHLQQILSSVPSYTGTQWIAEYGCTIPNVIDVSPQTVLDHLDGSSASGGYYRVNFGGHGGEYWTGANPDGLATDPYKVFSSMLRTMSGDDGEYCTGYAFNCLTGAFFNPNANRTVVETWLGADDQVIDAPLGPIYIGNSSAGQNASVPGGSSSQQLNHWYLDALYNLSPVTGTWGAADALNMASIVYAGAYLDGYPEVIPPPINPGNFVYEPMWDLKSVNLGGDPANPVWLQEPLMFYADYPTQLLCPSDLSVSVATSDRIPLPGVRVCLLMEGAQQGYEIYRRGFTDSSGLYQTFLDPRFTGTLFVTLTKQGYLPDEGEVRLIVE